MPYEIDFSGMLNLSELKITGKLILTQADIIYLSNALKSSGNTSLRIDECELSVRTANRLRWAGMVILNDIINKTPNELLGIKGFGQKCLSEVNETLRGYGLYLRSNYPTAKKEGKHEG